MNGRIASILTGALTLMTPAVSSADTAVRQITYTFTYHADSSASTSAAPKPAEEYYTAAEYENTPQSYQQTNDTANYSGPLSEKGAITVSLLGTQQDGGLIVTVSENVENARPWPAIACIVYGDTRVLCEPKKKVSAEEYTLMRFLGRNFIEASNLDAHRHWQVVQNSASMNVTSDYTLGADTKGDVAVSEAREIREANGGGVLTGVRTKIVYDTNRNLPISVDEYVTRGRDNRVAGASATYHTTLNLASDTTTKM